MANFLALWHVGREVFWEQRACLRILKADRPKRRVSLLSTVLTLFSLTVPSNGLHLCLYSLLSLDSE